MYATDGQTDEQMDGQKQRLLSPSHGKSRRWFVFVRQLSFVCVLFRLW